MAFILPSKPVIVALALLLPAWVGADQDPTLLQGISVIGERSTAPGSAHQVDDETLEQDEYDNINRVLNDVPGVYIRGEDGYGLRPNIGLRGTTTERSQKITLMMDGVPIAPAVYSAPSAYFFPQVSRMVGVEVLKGPGAIANGPATVGGSINLISRPIPGDASGGLDFATGSDDYGKAHGYVGRSNESGGFLIEGIQTRSDGFKDLDSGGDTGFRKSDLTVKGRLNSDPSADTYHQLDLTINIADETSDETYLGLSDEDFARDPYRRYAASQNARFTWDYQQAHLQHRFEPSADLALVSEAYYQEFQRDWNKLATFNSSRTLSEILANPDAGLNAEFMAVLRGEKDSETDQETLLVGNNGREFFLRGVQTRLEWQAGLGATLHDVTVGLRLHQDQVERNHTEQGFLMRGGTLQADGDGNRTTLLQRERSDAVSLFIKDEITYGRLRVTPGVRFESVDYESVDRSTGSLQKNSDQIWLPGLGIHYQLTDSLGILAGVHRGFVPSGPGKDDDIDPETSISYEAGFRFGTVDTQAEVIGFFNDYSNLLGVCTFSSGCLEATGNAFNGGEVDIYGIEALLRHEWHLASGWRLPVGLTYTFTQAEFKSDFDSNFALWGNVRSGDEVPYMPEHKASGMVGLGKGPWDMALRVAYVGEQREQAGSGGALAGSTVDAHTVLDLSGQYRFMPDHQVYARVDNLLDEEYMLSRRPLGARPGIDRTVVVGYKLQF